MAITCAGCGVDFGQVHRPGCSVWADAGDASIEELEASNELLERTIPLGSRPARKETGDETA